MLPKLPFGIKAELTRDFQHDRPKQKYMGMGRAGWLPLPQAIHAKAGFIIYDIPIICQLFADSCFRFSDHYSFSHIYESILQGREY